MMVQLQAQAQRFNADIRDGWVTKVDFSGQVHKVWINGEKEIEDGKVEKQNNLLKNAPHTQFVVINSGWDKNYSREQAAFPLPYLKSNKFWPSISRVNNTYGDRNLVCTCEPVSSYAE